MAKAKKGTKKSNKAKSSKSSRKVAKKTSTVNVSVKSNAYHDVHMHTDTYKSQVNKEQEKALAWIGIVVNLLILPGLGTMIAGSFAQGALQLIVSLIGLFFIITSNIGLATIILIISFIWSVTTCVAIIRNAASPRM